MDTGEKAEGHSFGFITTIPFLGFSERPSYRSLVSPLFIQVYVLAHGT